MNHYYFIINLIIVELIHVPIIAMHNNLILYND